MECPNPNCLHEPRTSHPNDAPIPQAVCEICKPNHLDVACVRCGWRFYVSALRVPNAPAAVKDSGHGPGIGTIPCPGDSGGGV